MCKVISISSQKGGTGKTSSCINIGAALAKEGKRVLLVDNDPQGHLTIGLGFDKRQKVTLKTILENCIEEQELQVEEAILHHEEKLDLIPANKSLGIMNVYLSSIPEGETILRDVLDTIRSRYDYIIIDCGPSIGMRELLYRRYSERYSPDIPWLWEKIYRKYTGKAGGDIRIISDKTKAIRDRRLWICVSMKGGGSVAKTGKYFRLSEQAVQMLEQRDRLKYPHEVDLIEAGILAADGKKQDTEELLCEIRQELFELKRLVADNKAEEDYPLPRL